MHVKCPSCQQISELQLPVLLAVCACGTLVRGRVTTQPGSATSPQNERVATLTHYEVLGLQETCTESEIKSAYRQRVKETHPDAGGNADDFKLVQMAYEVLSNPEKRRDYDTQGLHGGTSQLVSIPDLIGKFALQAINHAATNGCVVRVAIIEVENNSKLHGRVIGQFPYPDSQSDLNVVGVIIAIGKSATIWQRVTVIAADLAVGFWSGLKATTVGIDSPTRELGTTSTSHNVGAFVGETIGEIASGAAQATLGIFGCIGYVLLTIVALIALAINPAIGLIVLAFSIFVIARDRQTKSKRW